MFSTTNVLDKWGFERKLSYERYPEEKSPFWSSSFRKKLIKLHGGQLDVNTNIYLKSCAYHPDSECCTFFHENLSNPKSSEDTLLYLYVIWNMLKSADLHDDLITMAWRCISPWSFHRSFQRRRKMEIFHICQQIFAFWSKNNQKKGKTSIKTLVNTEVGWSTRNYPDSGHLS